MNNICWFSEDRLYRYTLEHNCSVYTGSWNFQLIRTVMFVGLNPSTADENKLDPTLRRLRQFTLDWGYDSFVMTNLFAFRSTDPYGLTFPEDPVGPENNKALELNAARADLVVACWGNNGRFKGRDAEVKALLTDYGQLHYLALTKKGQPSHPLYLPKTLEPKLWT